MWKRMLGELMLIVGVVLIYWDLTLDLDGSYWYARLIVGLIFGISWALFSVGFDLVLGERLKEREKEVEEYGKPLF